MIYRLRLKLSWNKVAHTVVEARDDKELKEKLPRFWKRNLTRTTVERELK